MVRDLEQIKENGENQLIAKKEKCSSHVNANGQHCKFAATASIVDNHVYAQRFISISFSMVLSLQAVQIIPIWWTIMQITLKYVIGETVNAPATIAQYLGMR